MISSLYLKLILSGTILAVVVAGYFYVTGLQNKVEALKTDNIVLKDDNKELKETNEAQDKFQEILNQVTAKGDVARSENKAKRDTDSKSIDDKVIQGKDKPVGPLLKEFLNVE